MNITAHTHTLHLNGNSLTKAKPTKKKKFKTKHYHRHWERPFLAHEREHTTLLVGGLSPTHDLLFEASLKGLGYKAKALPPTNIEAFHLGREYGNNGYCNPGYFTVGNLILYLRQLLEEGLSHEEIIENYVFFTIGCNAPCRFGMLEAEYRMALEDCGFDGFRILVFQNEGGLKQKVEGNGFNVDPEFFLATVNALNLADTINNMVYATRPYEVNRGETNEVKEKALKFLYQKLATKQKLRFPPWLDTFFKKTKLKGTAFFIGIFLEQITSKRYTAALREVRKMFSQIKIDRRISRTKVKITGEFWAMTTVGDGNFDLFNFLEKEGAEIMVEPVASIIQFLFSKGLLRHRNRKSLILRKGIQSKFNFRQRTSNWLSYHKKALTLKVGLYLFRREYHRLLDALGGNYHHLIRQEILQNMAHRYYNINIEGGEGYMEITKNIYYHKYDLAHMVVSLKPFGCMPSTQSDGAQALAIEDFSDIIYIPIETAGEGKTNAQSRVLMALGEARVKAKLELQRVNEMLKNSKEAINNHILEHPELCNPTYAIPHYKGFVSVAGNFMIHVDELINKQ